MRNLKKFNSQSEAINYVASTPFVSTIKGQEDKYLIASKADGDKIKLVADESGFIKYVEKKNAIKYSANGLTNVGVNIPSWEETWTRKPESDKTIGGTPYYAYDEYDNGENIYYFDQQFTVGESYENVTVYELVTGELEEMQEYDAFNLVAVPVGYAGELIINQGYFNAEMLVGTIYGTTYSEPRASQYDCEIDGIQYYCYTCPSDFGCPEGACIGVTEIFYDNQTHNQTCKVIYGGTILNSASATCKYCHYDQAYNGPLQQTLPIVGGINNEVEYNGQCVSINATKAWQFITAVEIPNSVTKIYDYAFNSCYALTSVTIPNSVTSIEGDAFRYCTALTAITIPNSVTSIGKCAFQSCTGLTSIIIPDNVTSLGYNTFWECTSLATATIERTTPPSAGHYIFRECTALTAIYVPAESVDAYKTATNWDTYADKIQAMA